MKGLNTLQAAWEMAGRPLHGTAVEGDFQAASYAGASAALDIAKDAASRRREAFVAIVEGLEAEIREFAAQRAAAAGHPAEHRERARKAIAGFHTFGIPLVGDPQEAARRVEFAIWASPGSFKEQEAP